MSSNQIQSSNFSPANKVRNNDDAERQKLRRETAVSAANLTQNYSSHVRTFGE